MTDLPNPFLVDILELGLEVFQLLVSRMYRSLGFRVTLEEQTQDLRVSPKTVNVARRSPRMAHKAVKVFPDPVACSRMPRRPFAVHVSRATT